MKYLAIDGDDIGDRVEYAIVEIGTVEAAMEISREIMVAQQQIADLISTLEGSQIYFQGGDNTFASVPDDFDDYQKFIDIYLENTNHTATVGVGNTPLEAHNALVIGKNTGKNKVVVWSDELIPHLEIIKKQLSLLDKKIEEVKKEYPIKISNVQELKEREQEGEERKIFGPKKPKFGPRRFDWLTPEQYSGGTDFDKLFWNRQQMPVPGYEMSTTFAPGSDRPGEGPLP
jgi:hypothetical protein